MTGPETPAGVVLITRDRPGEAAAAVARVRALPKAPELVAVGLVGPNRSTDHEKGREQLRPVAPHGPARRG